MVALLELGWRSVAERFEQAAAVVPCDPLERRELDVLEPVLRQNPVRQRGASSSARRPGCTGNRTLRKPERIAPCRLRSLRETLTRRGGPRATAYPPRGGLATQRRLSDCKHWGVGAPGGTRTPGIRLRSPSVPPVFSASCRTGSTLEGTNRLKGSPPLEGTTGRSPAPRDGHRR